MYLVEKLKGEEIAGHVTLAKGERSALAELGERLLWELLEDGHVWNPPQGGTGVWGQTLWSG